MNRSLTKLRESIFVVTQKKNNVKKMCEDHIWLGTTTRQQSASHAHVYVDLGSVPLPHVYSEGALYWIWVTLHLGIMSSVCIMSLFFLLDRKPIWSALPYTECILRTADISLLPKELLQIQPLNRIKKERKIVNLWKALRQHLMQRNVFRLSWFLYFKIEIRAVIRIFFVFCVRNVWRLYTYASFYFFFRFVFLPLGFL